MSKKIEFHNVDESIDDSSQSLESETDVKEEKPSNIRPRRSNKLRVSIGSPTRIGAS